MTQNYSLDTLRESGLVQPEELLEWLKQCPERIRLVDATYPTNPESPKIANAVTFDIDDIADPDSDMLHMLPSPDLFAEKIGQLGIGNDDFVIAYDQSGLAMAASRVWWMFRVFGHDNVAVLDGGLYAWRQRAFPVNDPIKPEPKTFKAAFRPELVVSYEEMKTLSAAGSALILDARPPERFVDHIPNSANLPALSLLDADRRLKPAGLEIADDSKIVATCGSGITACVIALALYREGLKNTAVYDGSWTEWSSK